MRNTIVMIAVTAIAAIVHAVLLTGHFSLVTVTILAAELALTAWLSRDMFAARSVRHR
jgi:hypothetical protein